MTPNFSTALNGLTATFTNTSTADGDTITGYSWAFGDGQSSTDMSPIHTYAIAGTYTVVLTLTASDDSTQTKSVNLVVGASGVVNDTLAIKGFVSYSALANNTAGVTAALGELSTYAKTYAKDVTLFGGSTGGSTPSAVELNVFSSVNADGSVAVTPTDYAANILTMVTWMYTQSAAGQFTADANVFLQAFQAQYAATIKTVTCGNMVSQNGMWLPGSLQFYFVHPSSTSPANTDQSRIKLWFADAVFRNEYDLYAMAFVSPIMALDDFFKPGAAVQTAVNARTVPQLAAAVAAVTQAEPYTIFDAMTFNWMDPLDANHFIPAAWSYVIWGAAGNNVDSIKQALQQYILDNSTHSRDEWAVIFPDIFTATEFILTPMWTQYAIPNQTLLPGMYQPTVNPNQAVLMAQATAIGAGYSDEFVSNVINVVPTPYKAMTFLAVGGPANRGGISEFAKRWPDYLDVPTSSIDFDRMTPDTQGFVQLLQRMLKVAEDMTESSDVPVGMTRLHRTNAQGDTVLYVVAGYDSVEYLVVAKSWMIAKYGASTNTAGSIGISYSGTYNAGAYQLLSSNPQMALQFEAFNAVQPNIFEILDTTISTASINPSTGAFVGTFPTDDLYTLTLKLTDSQAHAVTSTFTFNFQKPQTGGGGGGNNNGSLTFGTQTTPDGVVGQTYHGSIAIVGGLAPYTLGNIALPAGITAAVAGNIIVLSGNPISATDWSGPGEPWQLTVTDAGGGTAQVATLQFGFDVAPQPANLSFGTENFPDGVYGQAYVGTVAIVGGNAPYSLTGQTLPLGASAVVDEAVVRVSGTLTQNGAVACELRLTDSTSGVAQVAVLDFTINISGDGA